MPKLSPGCGLIVAVGQGRLKRPTGESWDQYGGFSHKNGTPWSSRRWAWEFLRRDWQFICECEEIAAVEVGENRNEVLRKKVASKYGLLNYQSWRYPSPPTFDVRRIKVIGWKEPMPRIRLDQVAIVFNLQQAIDLDRSLDAQLERARSVLIKERDDLAQFLRTPVVVTRLRKSDDFKNYLRALDLEFNGFQPREIAEIVWPHLTRSATESNKKAASRFMAYAREWAAVGYREIAAMPEGTFRQGRHAQGAKTKK